MILRAGTSGFSFPEWRGAFYPADLPARRWLEWYADRLPTTEINGSFYRLPTERTIAAWAATVPEGFRFSMKIWRAAAHAKDLSTANGYAAMFLERIRPLEHRIGSLFVQVPDNRSATAERVRSLAAMVPEPLRCAFDLPDAIAGEPAVRDMLSDPRFVRAIVDADDREPAALEPGDDWGYVRLRRTTYSPKDLAGWKRRLRGSGWKEAFVYFRHEDSARGPAYAIRLIKR